MANWVACSFVGKSIEWVDSTCSVTGGLQPPGGDVSHWLEPLPPEIEKIIEEVAEKEAAKDDPAPPSKVKIAPLKTALRMADFQYKPDYSDLYRVAYEKAYERLLLERDEEEALFLLM